MAATNFTPIQLYFSTTASAVPTAANLAQGELAINITDGKLYYEDNGGVVQVIATKGAGTIGGSTTQIQYNNAGALAGNAAMTFNSGTNTTTLTTLNLTNALGAIYGGTAQSAYTQGDVLYASATNTLSKLGIGTVNYILTSTGSVPQWVAPTSVTVNTATNLAGGVAGSVPYQSGVATTTFLAIGAANRVMTSTGTAPQWVTSLTGLTGVSSSSITNTSLTSGRVVISSTAGLESDSANLTFNGTTLSTTGLSNTGFSTLVKTLTLGDSSFNGTAVFAAATPAKLYMGTGTVTDVTSAISATNGVGAIASLAITPIAATNTGVTYTNASTLYIAGAPSAGTNITITNPYSLYIAAGASYFGGAVDFAVTPSYSGGTANGVMYLNGSKQITTGAVLTFDGTTLSSTKFAGALNGTVGATTANTGAFTTLSATGDATITNASANAIFTLNPVASTYSIIKMRSIGVLADGLEILAGSAQAYYSANTHNFRNGAQTSTYGTFSSTGLAVTGTLSATSGISATYAALTSYLEVRSDSSAIYQNNAANTRYWASLVSGGSSIPNLNISYYNGSVVSTVAQYAATGLAVTGTLSSTLGATIQGLTVGLGAGAVSTNTAVGASALAGNSSGANNTALGYQAGYSNTTGQNLVAIGYLAGYTSNANNSTFVGYYSGQATTGTLNTFVGVNGVGYLVTSGTKNTIIGGYSGNQGGLDIRTASNYIVLSDGDGNPRGVFDASGNLGIGTTSPSFRLSVVGGQAQFSNGSNLYLNATATEISYYTDAAVPQVFYTNALERMRLDSSGNLLVGKTVAAGARIDVVSASGGAALQVRNNTATITTVGVWNDATSGDNTFVNFYTEAGATTRGSITYNRAGGLVAYNVTSDYRAKDIYGPVQNPGALIDSVPVYMGKMKDATQERPMFIAHETPIYAHTGEKDAVDKDGKPVYQQMDASSLIPVMWAELQSLRARVAQLESKP